MAKEKKEKAPKPPKAAKPPAPKPPKAPKPVGPRINYPNDIYTVLASIAVLATVGAISFVLYRSNEIFGTPFPGFKG